MRRVNRYSLHHSILFTVIWSIQVNITIAQEALVGKADFGGLPRALATGFNIGNKGYIGTGSISGGSLGDLWEYTPTYNVALTNLSRAGCLCSDSSVTISIKCLSDRPKRTVHENE